MSSRTTELYPIAVLQDRYGGCYSRGAWFAIACANERVEGEGANRATWALDDGPSGDDITCSMFWGRPPSWVAVGDSPDAAVSALLNNGAADDPNWSAAYLRDEHPAVLKWQAFLDNQAD